VYTTYYGPGTHHDDQPRSHDSTSFRPAHTSKTEPPCDAGNHAPESRRSVRSSRCKSRRVGVHLRSQDKVLSDPSFGARSVDDARRAYRSRMIVPAHDPGRSKRTILPPEAGYIAE
jgi:hypothetical protein